MKHIPKISLYVVYLVAFALGIKQIHEPDLWWMFRTGEWMVQNGQIPTVDVFSFTLKGTEWISVKWLFELIAYGFAVTSGPESIGILQSVINVLLVLFLVKTISIISSFVFDLDIKPSHPLVILGALLFLFSSDYRLVGRPEMFSHLLTIIYIYLFLKYKSNPGRFIFWLIPLQIIWVNMHEAFAVGMVVILLFSFGEIFDYLISKNKDKKKLQLLLLASGLALLAVAVNPRGFYMFYHPYFLFTVVGSNHYTNELNSLFYRPDFYFSFKEPFFAFAAFGLSVAGVIWLFIKFKWNIFAKVSSGYIVAFFAFLYLGITGYRNVIFPIIVIFPFAISIVIYATQKWTQTKWFSGISYLIYLLPIAFYIGIGTNSYYENFQTKDRYGLAIYADSNPTGASKFITDHHLENQRAFTDYLTSSYFLWDLRPGFESFIDLRDLDIFPEEFFEEFIRITHFTNYFEDSDAKYGYNHVILYSWQFPNLHRYLYHSPNWVQVYADNVAAVYVKNNDLNQHLIKEFQPDSTNLLGNFNSTYQLKPSSISNIISYTIWPGYQMRSQNLDTNISASKYFRIVADYDRAEFHAQNAIKNNKYAYEGYNELGSMYLEIVPFKRTNEGKLQYITMANNAFGSGMRLDRSRWECIHGLGLCSFATGDYGYAIKQFKKAQKANPKEISNYIKIADCYAMLAQQNQSQKNIDGYFENMNIANKMDPDNMSLIAKLAIGYCQRNECELAKPFLRKYVRTSDITDQDHQDILNCKKKCDFR